MKSAFHAVGASAIGVFALLFSGFAVAESWTNNIGQKLGETSLLSKASTDVGRNHLLELCSSDFDESCVLAFDWSAGIGEYERISVDNEFCYNPFDFPRKRLDHGHFVLDLARVFESQSEAEGLNESVYGWRGGKKTVKRSAIAHQIGHPVDLEELIRRLLGAIRELSPYDMDVESPAVHSMPLNELHQRLCGRPCTIRAAYVPGEGLYMDEMMRPLSNQYDQSILFHELVHHVQEAALSHLSDNECQRWRKREFEAYALQNRFLFALDSSARVLWPGKLCARADNKRLATQPWFGWYSE